MIYVVYTKNRDAEGVCAARLSKEEAVGIMNAIQPNEEDSASVWEVDATTNLDAAGRWTNGTLVAHRDFRKETN